MPMPDTPLLSQAGLGQKEARADMLGMLQQRGIDPGSPEGQNLLGRAQELLGYGRVQPGPQMAPQNIPTPYLYQQPGAKIRSSTPLTFPEQGLEANILEESRRQQLAPRVQKKIAWLQNPEAVTRVTENLGFTAREKKGKGKGKWVPFEALPVTFQESFSSFAQTRPAGWWTGDLGPRQKVLLNRLALEQARKKKELAVSMPSGPASATQTQRLQTFEPSGPGYK